MADLIYKIDKTPEDVTQLIEDNKKLIYHMLKELGQLYNQDAESAAWEALWDAVNMFDVYSTTQFSTYACTVIGNRINGVLREGQVKKRKAFFVDIEEIAEAESKNVPVIDIAVSNEAVEKIYAAFDEYIADKHGVSRDVLLAWRSTEFTSTCSNLAKFCNTAPSVVGRIQVSFRAFLSYRLTHERK